MLTATYTLVALSVEQASIRLSLSTFQNYVQSTLVRQQCLTLEQMEYACESLHRLYQACHWRKIEMYLIPAIRQATEQADSLLDELGRLNQAALGVIRSLRAQAGRSGAQSEQQVREVCAAIDSFCVALLRRLDKEEKELFAVARSVICGEAWFAIANQFLTHDAHVAETRRGRAAAAPLQLVARADTADVLERGVEAAVAGLVALPLPGQAERRGQERKQGAEQGLECGPEYSLEHGLEHGLEQGRDVGLALALPDIYRQLRPRAGGSSSSE